eukprot:scaffold15972_cov73-Cyclotella_meneghiniana.AAC.5
MHVQIHLRAERLSNISLSRWRRKKSNPYAIITLLSSDPATNSTGSSVLGTTEVLNNTLNPRWSTVITLDHDESTAWTPLRIGVHDRRTPTAQAGKPSNESAVMSRIVETATPLDDDSKMGEVDLEVGQIIDNGETEFKFREGGSLFVYIAPSVQDSTARSPLVSVLLPLPHGIALFYTKFGLDFKNIESGILNLGAIDPYFELSKKYFNPSNGTTHWQLDLDKLCNGEIMTKELRITVYDYEKKSAHRFLGEIEGVTVQELVDSVTRGGNASRELALRVLDEKGNVVGLLVVLKAEFTFIKFQVYRVCN